MEMLALLNTIRKPDHRSPVYISRLFKGAIRPFKEIKTFKQAKRAKATIDQGASTTILVE
jgi:hypothetical protein